MRHCTVNNLLGIFFLCIVVFLTTPVRAANCDRFSRCTNEENVQWATDGRNCFILRNKCKLDGANCIRRISNLQELRRLPRRNCQRLCPKMCLMVFDPVCATYNGRFRTFGNDCRLTLEVCTTGQTWTFKHKGECGQRSRYSGNVPFPRSS